MYGDDIIMLDDSLLVNDERKMDSIIILDSDEDEDKKDGYFSDRQVIENSLLSLPSTSHLSESASSVDIVDTSRGASSTLVGKSAKMFGCATPKRHAPNGSLGGCFLVPDSDDEDAPQDVSMANDMSFGPVVSPSTASSKSLDSFADPSNISDMSSLSGAIGSSFSSVSPKHSVDPSLGRVSIADTPKKQSLTPIPNQKDSGSTANNSSSLVFKTDKYRSSTASNSSGISDNGPDLSSESVRSLESSDHSLHRNVNNKQKNRRSNDSSYVSQKEESPRLSEKQRCLVKISEVSDEIKIKKDVLKSVDLATLPDRGVRLQLAVTTLEKELRLLRQEFNNLPDDEPQPLNDSLGNDRDSSIIVIDDVHPKVLTVRDVNSQNKPVNNSSGSHTFAMIRGMDSVTMDSLKNLHDSLKTCPAEDVKEDDPEGLKITLMPHQRHGLAWMLWREQQVPSGGILADDMGLGKTLSMISLILKHKELVRDDKIEDVEANLRGGTLIVCPTSLLGQWKNEIDRRCKQSSLSVCIHHGTDRSTGIKSMRRHDIVITTYGIVMRECASIQKKVSARKEDGPLHTLEWTRIILDEAHVVRNHKSQTSQAICYLKGKYRWALTGTPIHNKELDLFALIVFLRCSPFDKYLTWRRWVDNKTAAGAQRLNMLMKSLMLRRTKEQLQSAGSLVSLPERQLHQMKIELEPAEQAVYDQILILSRNLFAKFMDQHAARMESKLSGELGSQTAYPSGESGMYSSGISEIWSNPSVPGSAQVALRNIPDERTVKSHHLLVLLLRLRQICCHPGLIQSMLEAEDYKTDGIVDDSGLDVDLISQLNSINLIEKGGDEDGSDNCQEHIEKNPLTMKNPVFRLNRPSTKINALFSCLKENVLDGPDKAVLVSQWTSLLDLIGDHLKRNGIKFYMLNGAVPLKTRTEIVEGFNNNPRGPKVLLLSLKAGGVGLNLVGGNHLLLVDLHWNPQLEAQACDRIYRVGQKKGVHVYRFICKHTVEEKIHELQEKKLTMAENVLTGAKNPQSNKLTLEDLKLLFTSSSSS